MDEAHRRSGNTSPKARKRGERSSSPRRRQHHKRDGARPMDHNSTFHSERTRSHQSGLVAPSYILHDPTSHRRCSNNGHLGGSEETKDRGASSMMDSRPSSARMDVESSRLQSLVAPHHRHLIYGSVPEYPSYIIGGGAKSPPSLLSTRTENIDPYTSLSSGPATAIAIDAETGRPVRILAHATASYGHLLAGGGEGSTHTHPTLFYPSAAESSFLSSLYGRPSSAELLQHQTPTLAAAAEGRNAVIVQRPDGSLPLYITDPLAPSTDLAFPPLPPQDSYSICNKVHSSATPRGGLEELVARRRLEDQSSTTALLRQHQEKYPFSNNVPSTGPPRDGLEELVARRRLEEQASATTLLGQQQEEYTSHNPPPRNILQDQEQHLHAHHSLVGHVPSYQLFQSLPPVQQHQQHAHRRSLPIHKGSSLSPKNDPEPDPPSVVPQDLPDPRPGKFPAVLFCEADEERLTSYQCLLRKQLELFEADMEDVRHSTRQGRTAPIKFGQVGVRCRHCASSKVSAGTKGASYYSQTIDGIYQVSVCVYGASNFLVVFHNDFKSQQGVFLCRFSFQ
jgi:hypothetical protein